MNTKSPSQTIEKRYSLNFYVAVEILKKIYSLWHFSCMQIQGLECYAVTVSRNYVAQLYFPFDRTHQEFMRVTISERLSLSA